MGAERERKREREREKERERERVREREGEKKSLLLGGIIHLANALLQWNPVFLTPLGQLELSGLIRGGVPISEVLLYEVGTTGRQLVF